MNFKTPAGEAAFMAAYDAALAAWPVPYTIQRVPTGYGTTHVIVCGPEEGEPLVLLHAMGTGSPVWIRNVAALSRTFRTYLVDIPGDANKSEWTAPFRSRADSSKWLTELLDGLALERTHMGGMSYGGFTALNFALANPGRLKRMFLVAPAASLDKLPFSFFVHFLGPAIIPSRALVHKTFCWLSATGHSVDERLADQMFLGVRHFRFAKGMYPSVFTDDELRRLRVPTLLLIGEQEVIYADLHRAVDRAVKLIPGIQAELVPNASHLLIMERPDVVNQRVLAFLA